MSWSPADDYDDQGNYVNPLRPRYKRNCEGCYCVARRACETWPGDQYPDPEGFMLDPDNHH